MNKCKDLIRAIKEDVIWFENNKMIIRTYNQKGQIIDFGFSYCPFCGKQLVINELKMIEVIE